MKNSIPFLLLITVFSACSSHTKRIMVIAKGSAIINTDTKTITLKDGGGTDEKTADFNQSGALNIELKKEDGTTTINIADKGLYMLNGKNDTIIGSYQQYGAVPKETKIITQAELAKDIDSLIALTENKNVSSANKNYFILPYHAVKITDNIDAFIVAPYHRMTSIEKQGNADPEVYRFWSIKEIRETIDHLKTMTKKSATPINN